MFPGLNAVCYKREYSFDADKDKQYEERGCVENKSYLGEDLINVIFKES